MCNLSLNPRLMRWRGFDLFDRAKRFTTSPERGNLRDERCSGVRAVYVMGATRTVDACGFDSCSLAIV